MNTRETREHPPELVPPPQVPPPQVRPPQVPPPQVRPPQVRPPQVRPPQVGPRGHVSQSEGASLGRGHAPLEAVMSSLRWPGGDSHQPGDVLIGWGERLRQGAWPWSSLQCLKPLESSPALLTLLSQNASCYVRLRMPDLKHACG